ncbi:MAG: thiosulfate oxidation carrier complex protein SoxZ [Betaproteobacteria bacterium]|nr:thiosulfate oxidation carrier complex protein SoxZ [Betaproteobacteria bacterium]
MAMKLRASMSGDTADIKCLMNHPMETGMRKDASSGKVVPAHYISNVTCTVGGKTVVDAQWGGGISKNPYLALKVKGAKSGDSVTVSWVDNMGEKESVSAKIA